jgi:hypothetical protein
MATTTITIIVSLIAAITSLLSLVININSSKRREIREGNRKTIEPLIEELGKQIYGVIAAIALLYKDDSVKNQKYWNSQVLAAQRKLRELRPKLRYPLWGLDDAIKTLILLPGLAKLAEKKDLHTVIVLATYLRKAMDNVIRKCFKYGRTPNYIERKKIQYRVNALFEKWQELKEFAKDEIEFNQISLPAKKEMHKIKTVVIEVGETNFIAKDNNGQEYNINKRAKVDKKSSKFLEVGAEVSLFKREVDRDFHYSFVKKQVDKKHQD